MEAGGDELRMNPEGIIGRIGCEMFVVEGEPLRALVGQLTTTRLPVGLSRPHGRGAGGACCSYRLQVSEGGVENVRGRVRFGPRDLVYELESHRLQGETEAEDNVVGAGNPDRPSWFEDAARFLQPPDVEPVILHKPHRANRVTTPCFALPGARRRDRHE